jgi:hypothetical protein
VLSFAQIEGVAMASKPGAYCGRGFDGTIFPRGMMRVATWVADRCWALASMARGGLGGSEA